MIFQSAVIYFFIFFIKNVSFVIRLATYRGIAQFGSLLNRYFYPKREQCGCLLFFQEHDLNYSPDSLKRTCPI